jgi:NADPH:quinone reductase-like Zn-dependent oxidoreductase
MLANCDSSQPAAHSNQYDSSTSFYLPAGQGVRGTPYIVRAQAGLSRPRTCGLGADLAGRVEAVGQNVGKFQPGDQVFGSGSGTFAEYVSIPGDAVVLNKSASLTFEQAASVPEAALTALQALRDKGH